MFRIRPFGPSLAQSQAATRSRSISHAPTSGNTLSLTLGDQHQSATIPGTGNWNGFREERIGEFDLTEGAHELVARSQGPIRDHLIDLRNIILRPISQ